MIVERGTHHQLLLKGGLYASMWNRQREAEEAREKLARVAEDPSAPNRNPPPRRRRSRARRDRGGIDIDRPCPIINSIRSQLAPIHPQGYPFIGGFALASLVLFWLWTPLGWIGTLATAWCAYFFRDPVRVTPLREGLVVSPADGRVSRVVNAVPPPELGLSERPLPRISIFMSVFDCHVNRSPMSGRIERMVYRAGKFINADLDKASEDNERNAFIIATRAGRASAWCRSRAWSRGASCRSCRRARRSRPATGSA